MNVRAGGAIAAVSLLTLGVASCATRPTLEEMVLPAWADSIGDYSKGVAVVPLANDSLALVWSAMERREDQVPEFVTRTFVSFGRPSLKRWTAPQLVFEGDERGATATRSSAGLHILVHGPYRLVTFATPERSWTRSVYDSLPDCTITDAEIAAIGGTVIVFGLVEHAWAGRSPTDEWFAVVADGRMARLPIAQAPSVRRTRPSHLRAAIGDGEVFAFAERSAMSSLLEARAARDPTVVRITLDRPGGGLPIVLEKLVVDAPSPLDGVAFAVADSHFIALHNGRELSLQRWGRDGVRPLLRFAGRTAVDALGPERAIALERHGELWVAAWTEREFGVGTVLRYGPDRASPARLHMASITRNGDRFRSQMLPSAKNLGEDEEDVDALDLRCDSGSGYVLMSVRPWKRPIRLRLARVH